MRDRPLLVRLCEAFVDNLALILRVALVLGAIAFVQELRDVREYFLPDGVDESMTAGPGSDEEPADTKSRAEDDIGFIARDDQVLYARLEPVTD